MEYTKMLSVGIDIGTSTTSVIFSHLTVANTAGYFSVPSVDIVDKQVVYRSSVYRTPLLDQSLIDGEKLQEILEKEYRTAGVEPAQVETGAVIITGESARKENANLILEKMSRFAGDFVVSTAGPDLESVIAGQGSGARQFSEESGAVVANLDIGGGTTNVVLFDGGEVRSRGCLDIGGRQVVLDSSGRISYISPSAAKIADFCHLELKEGNLADVKKLERICEGMNEALEQLLGISDRKDLADCVKTAGSDTFRLLSERPLKYLFFSGGVADGIYQPRQEDFLYGDIGILLGRAIRRGRLFQSFRVQESSETIRATVIGAGSYTTSISGSTISFQNGLFPIRNVPVLKLDRDIEQQCWKGDGSGLEEKFHWFLRQNDASVAALALEGRTDPDYQTLKKIAQTVTKAAAEALPPDAPLIVILKKDIAKALGQLLRRMTGNRPVIAIDEIQVEENNYVDFGNPIMNGLVIPVVVKTLILG